MTWADYLFWALVAVMLLYFGAWFHEVIEAIEARLLSFLPAREVGEPTARRTPAGLETLPATEGPPGDGGNPGAAHSRTDAAAPGTAIDVYARFTAALAAEGIAPWQEEQRRAPRHAPTLPRIDRIDISRPGVPVQTPDHPPWETETGSQPAVREVMRDCCMSMTDEAHTTWCFTGAARALRRGPDGYAWMALPAVTGAPGGCTGSTYPHRALGMADLGPAGPRPLAERVHTG